jgi:hypothetical protein
MRRPVNDVIYTDKVFARKIINHFSSQFNEEDRFMEPCRGNGSFYESLPEPKDWCEIDDNRNFLEYDGNCDWIISNFPWSTKLQRPIVRKACGISTNVVHLIRAHNALGTFARFKDFLNEQHHIKEIILCDWKEAFGNNKSQEGFALIVIHTQRNYNGDCKWTYWI